MDRQRGGSFRPKEPAVLKTEIPGYVHFII